MLKHANLSKFQRELSISNQLFGFPLVCAARIGNREVVSCLLKRIKTYKYSKIRIDVRDALAAAAERGDKELVDLLLDDDIFDKSKAGPYELVILGAARGGHGFLLDLLIQRSPNQAISNCFVNSRLGMKFFSLVYQIFKEAVANGHTRIVRRCLSNGPEFYSDGKGGVHDLNLGQGLEKAAHLGYANIVKLIVGCMPSNLEYRRESILRAISAAARRGYKNIVQMLGESGSGFDYGQIHGWNPLLAAATTGQAHIVRYLLGPDAHLPQAENFDLLCLRAVKHAAGKGYESVIREFVLGGIFITNGPFFPLGYQSALLTAMVAGRQNVVKLFLEIGAEKIDPSTTYYASEFENGDLPLVEEVANQDADRTGRCPYPESS
jgi:ankyrin repeat protein